MAKKQIFDKSAIMFIGALCAISLLVIVIRVAAAGKACPKVDITVSNAKPVENAPVVLSCENHEVKTWDWDFGDGTPHATTAIANHVYHSSRDYTVTLTINGKCATTTVVKVKRDFSALPLPVIEGPTTATVGVPAKFKETSGKGTSWDWAFQEPGGTDNVQNPTYIFKTAGRKEIEVRINGKDNSQVGYFEITVKPAADSAAGGGGGGGGGAAPAVLTEAQFIAMLNDVVARKKDASAFAKYLCGHVNLVITANGKQMPFDAFCSSVSGANYEAVFDNVALVRDPATKCITGAVVNHHKGKWAPWRKK